MNQRIQALDGLRCVAILSVLGFHFYYSAMPPRTTINFYPYGDTIRDFPLFQYGRYGVQLFFVISGFVIALTLQRCRTASDFAVRRFARLWPSMLLCSTITFAVLSLWAQASPAITLLHPNTLMNFLPSLTFIDPYVLNSLTDSHTFYWMDRAYWSLFVEVRFYVLLGALYFFSSTQFFRHIVLISSLILAASWSARLLHLPSLERLSISPLKFPERLSWLSHAAFFV